MQENYESSKDFSTKRGVIYLYSKSFCKFAQKMCWACYATCELIKT